MKRLWAEAPLRLTGRQSQKLNALVLEVTNRCSSACPVCGAAQGPSTRPKGDLPLESVRGLASEARSLGPNWIYLHAHGEPLLHPDLTEIIRELSGQGLRTQLATNGDRLDESFSRRLIEAGLSELVLSHPGASAENFLACRGRELSEQAEDRLIESLAPWREAEGQAAVRCLVVTDLVSDGPRSLAGFVEKWLTAPGVSRIEFTGYQPWPRHVLEEYLPRIFAASARCPLPLDTLTVLWDGSLTPCSYDANGELTLGRWPEMSLDRAFNCPQLRRIRRQGFRRPGRRPPLCRSCLLVRCPTPQTVVRPEDLKKPAGRPLSERAARIGRQQWRVLKSHYNPKPENNRPPGRS